MRAFDIQEFAKDIIEEIVDVIFASADDIETTLNTNTSNDILSDNNNKIMNNKLLESNY